MPNVKLSFNDETIGSILANGHVYHAIKYTKKIYDELKKSNSPELCMSGLITNLFWFLCTNKRKRHEKRQILLEFMRKLPLKHYAGWFSEQSWKIVENWVESNILNDVTEWKQLDKVYVSCKPACSS